MNITNHPSLYRDIWLNFCFFNNVMHSLYKQQKNSSKGIIKSAWWVKSRGNPLWTERKLDSTNCLRQGREMWKSWCHGISPSFSGGLTQLVKASQPLIATRNHPWVTHVCQFDRKNQVWKERLLEPKQCLLQQNRMLFRTAVVRTLRSACLWAERAACRATLLWLWSFSRSRSWSNRELHEKVSGHQSV